MQAQMQEDTWNREDARFFVHVMPILFDLDFLNSNRLVKLKYVMLQADDISPYLPRLKFVIEFLVWMEQTDGQDLCAIRRLQWKRMDPV